MLVVSKTIDYTDREKTFLCELAAKHGTDKTVFHSNPSLHRHPYTWFYQELIERYFLLDIHLVLGEVGILDNASMRMWNEYLSWSGELYGFEYDNQRIEKARIELPHVDYIQMNIQSAQSIREALMYRLFDILIDDSTHAIKDQVRFAIVAKNNLHSKSTLVIEDIYRDADEKRYVEALEQHYEKATFLTCNHALEHSPGWNNSKLLILEGPINVS
jgi:hypothetical protein